MTEFAPEPDFTSNHSSDKRDVLKPPPGPQKVEYLYVDENPLFKVPRQRGHFGPFPMKNTWDRLYYGTGLAYLGGLSYGTIYGAWRGFNRLILL